MRYRKIWFEILSDLFINLSAAWFAVMFIEPQIGSASLPLLTFRFILATVSLLIARYLRARSKTR